ncbi:DUF6864 domain-containing function [Flavobacterium sp. 25HG05S-40]|uniref:DUF6864 domain-containing function n=1 Tax=Flavobacterium sp. 25HG05S-40 TaxID=3458682 RepID=UPI004044B009
MTTKILYEGELELIDNGTFLHYSLEKPVTLSITESDGVKINIRLEFVYSKVIRQSERVFTFTEYNSDTLKITIKHDGLLANFGYVEPVKIGSFDGHELFFNLRVDINSKEDSPVIHYTWFKGKKEQL